MNSFVYEVCNLMENRGGNPAVSPIPPIKKLMHLMVQWLWHRLMGW